MGLNQSEQKTWEAYVEDCSDLRAADDPISVLIDEIPYTPAHIDQAVLDNRASGYLDKTQYHTGLVFGFWLRKQPDTRAIIAELPIEDGGNGQYKIILRVPLPWLSGNDQA